MLLYHHQPCPHRNPRCRRSITTISPRCRHGAIVVVIYHHLAAGCRQMSSPKHSYMGRAGGRQRGGSSSGTSSTREEEEEHSPVQETMETEETEAEEAIPRHTDGRMILDPTGLWFRSQTVVRGVTSSYLENIVHGVTCWSKASDEDKEMWFNNFRHLFYWTNDRERMVWERYNEVAKRRFRDNMYKVSRKKKAPSFMKGKAYEEFKEYRNTPEFKEASNRAKMNKRGGEKDGEVEATHFGGSQSFYDRAMSSKKKQGQLPGVVDLFLETHAKKNNNENWSFANKKDGELYRRFLVRKKKNPEVEDNELWFDLVEGFQGGELYGVGAAKELYFTPPPRSAPSSYQKTYTPSIVHDLQAQLQARDARDAERDEEIKQMKEQMEKFNSYFANCNSGWRPQDKDPRDPDNGGGSEAGASFPVF